MGWPALERPREKLLIHGAHVLSDAELLAIFLRTGVKGKSAVDLARELLSDFGSLRALLTADQQRFCEPLGLGSAKFAQLQAVLEMARRHLAEELQHGDALTSPELTRQYLQAQLRDLSYEVFACLFLDNQHRVLRYQELFRGTIDGAAVYPREVVKQALEQVPLLSYSRITTPQALLNPVRRTGPSPTGCNRRSGWSISVCWIKKKRQENLFTRT